MKPTDVVLSIARKELSDRLRNRWIWTVSALLALSALAIAFFGSAPVGVVGVQRTGAAMASLMNLAVYLVPLLALILGCGALIEEKQRGTLDLILVYPLSTVEFFFGTFLGFALALAVAVVSGFVLSGAVLSLWAGVDAGEYLVMVALALMLGVVFLALAFLLSILAKDRGRAVASSVLVWICTIFIFDLLLVGVLILSKGKVSTGLFSVLLLLNPTDVFRMLCFKWIGSAASPLGLAAVIPSGLSTALFTGVLVLWMAVPLFLSYALFQRRVANDTLA